MCNRIVFIAYILMVSTMKKTIGILFIPLITIVIILLNVFLEDKNSINKITIFLSAILSLLIAYLTGIIKQKNGLINGLIIGISISIISITLHFFFAKELFSVLYIRSAVIILSGACGGVLGVNKKTD